MGRITKCGCYLVVPGFFSHERHTGGLRWWAMGRRLPSFTGFSKPSSCVESGTEHLAKGNGVVSFWLTNLIAAWPRRNLEPGRSIATIFVGLLFFFSENGSNPVLTPRHFNGALRVFLLLILPFCLCLVLVRPGSPHENRSAGRHQSHGRHRGKTTKKSPKKEKPTDTLRRFCFNLNKFPNDQSHRWPFCFLWTGRGGGDQVGDQRLEEGTPSIVFLTHDLPKSTFYLVFTGFFFDDWFAVGFVVVFERSLECLPSFTEFLFCSNGWKSYDSVLPSFSLSLIVSTGFFYRVFRGTCTWNRWWIS